MSGVLVKIFAVSAFCMVLLGLVDGPMREVLRIGCAALAVLVTVSALTEALPFVKLELLEDIRVQDAVEQAQMQALESQQQIVSDALSDYIAQQGRAAGGVCTGNVIYRVQQDGRFELLEARVLWRSGSKQAQEVLRQALSHDFGLPSEQIIIEEVPRES